MADTLYIHDITGEYEMLVMLSEEDLFRAIGDHMGTDVEATVRDIAEERDRARAELWAERWP